MRINNINKVENRHVSYKGLYNNKVLVDKRYRAYDYVAITSYHCEYFPFKDETKDEIEAEREDLRSNKRLYPGESYARNRAYYYLLDVKRKLPITKKMWETKDYDPKLLKAVMGARNNRTITETPFLVQEYLIEE